MRPYPSIYYEFEVKKVKYHKALLLCAYRESQQSPGRYQLFQLATFVSFEQRLLEEVSSCRLTQ